MAMQNSTIPSTTPVLGLADGVAARWQNLILLVGRMLIGWIFITSGWRKLMDVPAFVKTMPRRDLPEFLGYVAPPVELLSGVFVLLGFATRYSSLMLILFMIIATFSSHRYWSVPVEQYTNQSSHFWKNVSMTGGIVLLFVTGAGRYAVDRLLMRAGGKK